MSPLAVATTDLAFRCKRIENMEFRTTRPYTVSVETAETRYRITDIFVSGSAGAEQTQSGGGGDYLVSTLICDSQLTLQVLSP